MRKGRYSKVSLSPHVYFGGALLRSNIKKLKNLSFHWIKIPPGDP